MRPTSHANALMKLDTVTGSTSIWHDAGWCTGGVVFTVRIHSLHVLHVHARMNHFFDVQYVHRKCNCVLVFMSLVCAHDSGSVVVVVVVFGGVV